METVGSASSRLFTKIPDSRDPIELEREMHKEFDENMWGCVDTNKKIFPKDFYVVVITKKEKLMQNVIRNYFIARESCPTPEWDQSVYKYIKNDDALDFLWTVPDKQTCELMLINKFEVPVEEHMLLSFVQKFYRGDLLKVAKRMNNERKDSPLLAA